MPALRCDWNFGPSSGDLAPSNPAPWRTVGRTRPSGRFFPEFGGPDIHTCISTLTSCTIGPLWYQPWQQNPCFHRIIGSACARLPRRSNGRCNTQGWNSTIVPLGSCSWLRSSPPNVPTSELTRSHHHSFSGIEPRLKWLRPTSLNSKNSFVPPASLRTKRNISSPAAKP